MGRRNEYRRMLGRVLTVGLASHWPCSIDTVVHATGSTTTVWDKEISIPPNTHSVLGGYGPLYLRGLQNSVATTALDIGLSLKHDGRGMEGGIFRFCRPIPLTGKLCDIRLRHCIKRWKHGTKLHFDKTCQQPKTAKIRTFFSDSGSGKNIIRIRLKGMSSSYVSDSSCQHGNVKRNPLTNRHPIA